jgi:triosephosphate isomerase
MQGLNERELLTTVICPPFVYLDMIGRLIENSHINLGAQDCSKYKEGSHTGDVSCSMLKDIGCKYVIVGHSERKKWHHEKEDEIATKLKNIVDTGLIPIICIGENIEERKEKKHLEVIREQIMTLNLNNNANAIIAYEPVWSIGTGIIPTIVELEEVLEYLQELVKSPVLYGGSVNGSNALELVKIKRLHGFLVGAASLNFEEILKIFQTLKS